MYVEILNIGIRPPEVGGRSEEDGRNRGPQAFVATRCIAPRLGSKSELTCTLGPGVRERRHVAAAPLPVLLRLVPVAAVDRGRVFSGRIVDSVIHLGSKSPNKSCDFRNQVA